MQKSARFASGGACRTRTILILHVNSKRILILIFAEALGLYGLIVGLVARLNPHWLLWTGDSWVLTHVPGLRCCLRQHKVVASTAEGKGKGLCGQAAASTQQCLPDPYEECSLNLQLLIMSFAGTPYA